MGRESGRELQMPPPEGIEELANLLSTDARAHFTRAQHGKDCGIVLATSHHAF
jgi:hypothetical protein